MTLTAAQLRALAARRLKIGGAGFDGSVAAYGALSPNDQLRLREEMVGIVLANGDWFDAATQAWAATLVEKEGLSAISQRIDDYTLTQAAADFAGELGNQAISVGESVAAVGEGVKNTLGLARWVLPVVALVAASAFLWPRVKTLSK